MLAHRAVLATPTNPSHLSAVTFFSDVSLP